MGSESYTIVYSLRVHVFFMYQTQWNTRLARKWCLRKTTGSARGVRVRKILKIACPTAAFGNRRVSSKYTVVVWRKPNGSTASDINILTVWNPIANNGDTTRNVSIQTKIHDVRTILIKTHKKKNYQLYINCTMFKTIENRTGFNSFFFLHVRPSIQTALQCSPLWLSN